MTPNKSLTAVVRLGLALIVIGFAAPLALGQSVYVGKFTAPYELRWGRAVLAPGQYTFTVDHYSTNATVGIRKDNQWVAEYIFDRGGYDRKKIDHSELVLVRSAGNYRVRALRLAGLDLTLEYGVPKAEKALVAQAPELLMRIPVMRGGK